MSMKRDTWRHFAIIYGVLLLVFPAYVFMFVVVGTLSVAAWVVVALGTNLGLDRSLAEWLAAWMAIEGLLAFGLAWVASRIGARTRRFAAVLGIVCTLSAAASPLYCYVQGVQEARGACTNALEPFRWGLMDQLPNSRLQRTALRAAAEPPTR